MTIELINGIPPSSPERQTIERVAEPTKKVGDQLAKANPSAEDACKNLSEGCKTAEVGDQLTNANYSAKDTCEKLSEGCKTAAKVAGTTCSVGTSVVGITATIGGVGAMCYGCTAIDYNCATAAHLVPVTQVVTGTKFSAPIAGLVMCGIGTGATAAGVGVSALGVLGIWAIPQL